MAKSRTVLMLCRVWELWNEHDVAHLAAALACYAMLSVAPLIILLLAAVGTLFGNRISRADTIDEMVRVLGPSAASVIMSLSVDTSLASSRFANSIAMVLLLFGASSVFVELRSSLNLVWNVRERHLRWYAGMVKDRLFAFLMVFGLGFTLIASLLVSTAITVFAGFFSDRLAFSKLVLHTVNAAASFVVIGVVFFLIFRFVPAIRIGWSDAAVGAFVTAVLFDLVRVPLALYLSRAHIGSAYGAAGSLVAFLFWVYISAQVFYLGGEFTRAYSESFGSLSKRSVEP